MSLRIFTRTAVLSLSLCLSLSLSLTVVFIEIVKILKYCQLSGQYCSMASPLTSALIAAAKEGNQERCLQLLRQGADVDGTDEVSREDEQIGGNV